MAILKNLPAAQKILMSLRPIEPLKKKIESAHRDGNLEAEKAAILETSYTWGTYLVDAFKAKITVYGRENLPTPEEAPVVFMCNHQGYGDIPALCHVLNTAQFGFMAKDNLRQIPVYGTWMRRVRSVMLKREDARASLKAIAQAINYIEEGSCMLVFPEGTRSWGGPMNEFKPGAFKLATKPKVPIIPISINGTYKIFEEPGYFQNGQEVRMIIHPAIPTAGLDRKEEKALVAKVQNQIAMGVAELREEMDMPELSAEVVEANKKRVRKDKGTQKAIKQLEKEERGETKKDVAQIKAEAKSAIEEVKARTRAVQEEAKAKSKAAQEEASALVKEAKEEEKAEVKKIKEAARMEEEAIQEAVDLKVSAAVLDAEYGDGSATSE